MSVSLSGERLRLASMGSMDSAATAAILAVLAYELGAGRASFLAAGIALFQAGYSLWCGWQDHGDTDSVEVSA